HYKAVNDTATILGIITPVLGAVFGVTIGYSAGNSTGQATGANNAKQKIKADLLPKLDVVAQNRARIPGDIHPELDQAIGYIQALWLDFVDYAERHSDRLERTAAAPRFRAAPRTLEET